MPFWVYIIIECFIRILPPWGTRRTIVIHVTVGCDESQQRVIMYVYTQCGAQYTGIDYDVLMYVFIGCGVHILRKRCASPSTICNMRIPTVGLIVINCGVRFTERAVTVVFVCTVCGLPISRVWCKYTIILYTSLIATFNILC